LAIVFFLFMVSKHESAEMLLGKAYFDMIGTTLTPESEAVLKRIAAKMRAEPNIMIDVNGYTDNTGASSANVILSKEMAEKVRTYLASRADETGGRIQAVGFGANNPIASNATEQGRAQNRRVEIVMRQPDAVLTSFDNDVRVQPPALRPGWLKPVPNYYLYRGYKVTTGKKSSARIVYPNKGVLRMGEDAMVIIHSLYLQREEKQLLKNIRLQDGSLTAILKDATRQADSAAIAPTAMSELSTQINDTLVAEKLEDLVVVYERNADVSEVGEKPVEDKSEGAVADRGDAFDEHRRPPAAPMLVSPQMNETKYLPDEIVFVWRPSGVLSHLQVAEDSLFQQIAFDTYAASDSVITLLTENLYYWRVSGVDKDSLEGEYSAHWTLVVELDTLKPQLEVVISRGAHDDQLIATGHADTDAELFINDEEISKDENGSFSYAIPRDYRSAFLVARAVDGAGNMTERSCRIPGVPTFVLGVNAGLCAVASDRGDEAESGFWYGIQFSRTLWPGVSFFVSTAIARTNGKMGDALNTTDIMPIEIGLRQSFDMGRLSPFLYIRSGFAWSQMSTVRQALSGAVNDNGVIVDPTMGFGVGTWLYVGGNWYLNLHADYTHVFNEGNDSENAKALTRIGFGIQDRM
jgi:hypothetical protein